jgi:hypothetical protein
MFANCQANDGNGDHKDDAGCLLDMIVAMADGQLFEHFAEAFAGLIKDKDSDDKLPLSAVYMNSIFPTRNMLADTSKYPYIGWCSSVTWHPDMGFPGNGTRYLGSSQYFENFIKGFLAGEKVTGPARQSDRVAANETVIGRPPGFEVTDHIAEAVAGLVALQMALETPGVTDKSRAGAKVLTQKLRALDADSFFGRLHFHKNGWNTRKAGPLEADGFDYHPSANEYIYLDGVTVGVVQIQEYGKPPRLIGPRSLPHWKDDCTGLPKDGC